MWPTGEVATGEAAMALVWPDDGGFVPDTWDAEWMGPPLASWEVVPLSSEGKRATGEDASAFRALREAFLADGLPDRELPLVTEGDDRWFVMVREDLPLPDPWALEADAR